MLVEACASEYARLMSLRRKHADAGGYLIEWLDYDIGQVEDKLGWFRALRERL